MSTEDEQTQSRAEFYLCLARAFLTPDSGPAWAALREALADDLEELGDSLGHEIAGDLAGYRAAMAAIPDQPALLRLYSALFLAPPRRVSLNTGLYLDGAIDGGSVLMMEESYRRGGLERCEAFKDLSDHLSIQLEFVARRYLASLSEGETEPSGAEFLHTFVARWLPPLIADLEREGATAPNPWLHLARLLSTAVARDSRALAEGIQAAPSRRQKALDKARHDRALAGVTGEDMAFIAQRLREQGLTTDHLSIPPERRDEARGLSKKVPPSPRRGSRFG